MKFYATAAALLIHLFALAQGGYEIKVTFKPFKNEYIYLGHYYGKQLPIIDSVKLNEKGEGTFKGAKKLGGGIYLVGYPDRSRHFEVLVDKNQKFSIAADTANIQNVVFTGSPENTAFKEYQAFMTMHGTQLDQLGRQLQASPQDSAKLKPQIIALNAKIKKYRTDIIAKDPEGILAALLTAMREPEVPQNHPAAAKDSMFAYKYYKAHYWDGVNFYDERLARTPFFEPKLQRYFDQVVYPSADSVNKEIDYMLGYASINEEMQKFLLLHFTNRYLNQKYMWEDAVFVNLFEKYYSNKTYPWLTEEGKKIITNRAYSLMANLTGGTAADITLPDTKGTQKSLYGVQAPYTLVAIWDPTCGHCKEVLPKLQNLYQTKWKDMGVKLFAMAKETDGDKKGWLDFIAEHKLQDWTHVYYSKEADKARIASGTPGYSQLYDVQSFPTLYLLDADKRIIAKKVTEEQVSEILEHRNNNK
ncbi:MAG: DUF5106 domain-containing protein [Chitinophagaceae bacterium]